MSLPRNKAFWITVGLSLAVVCFMIAVSVRDGQFRADEILRQGKTIPATVVSLSQRPAWASDAGSARSHFVTVRFPDERGQLQDKIAWQYVGWLDARRLRIGDSIEVVYLPHRVYTPYLKPSLLRLSHSGPLAFVALLGAVIGLGMSVYGLRLPAPSHDGAEQAVSAPPPVTD